MAEPKRELTITRTFDAPRDLVWRAWTDEKILKKWWGPRGVTNPTCEWDARPGGKIYIVMLAGKELGPVAGQKWPMSGTFKEVTPMSKLVYVGGAMSSQDDPRNLAFEQLITVDFEEAGQNKTKMRLHILVTKINNETFAKAALSGMEMGFNQQTDKLGELLQDMVK